MEGGREGEQESAIASVKLTRSVSPIKRCTDYSLASHIALVHKVLNLQDENNNAVIMIGAERDVCLTTIGWKYTVAS